MKCELFSVFDSAAQRFLEPIHAPTVEVALRIFRRTVNSPESQMNAYPEDYTLFHIGSFDQESGLIDAFDTPRSLGVAVTFVEPVEPQLKAVNDAP